MDHRAGIPCPTFLDGLCRPGVASFNPAAARSAGRAGLPGLVTGRTTRHFPGMEWRTGRSAKRPRLIEPCIPTLASRPPVGLQWVHEIKHDGYRLIARKQDGRVRLFTRRGYDWTDRYPRIVAAVAAIRASSITIDGEAVCCDANGLSIFEELHSRQYNDRAFLYAFDLLELDGEDYRPQPLHARKARLETLVAKVPSGIQYNEHVEGDGQTIFEHACKLRLEGIVSKHRERAYQSGRSKTWLKVKNPAAPGVTRFERA
jgi:bifunctional non-homologous end joining protein LigD